MTTNTTINYAKLADDAADTYTSARDALNRAIANLPTLHDVELNNNMRASESKFCTVDTMLTRHFYVEARERLSKAISRATKNMQERIKNA